MLRRDIDAGGRSLLSFHSRTKQSDASAAIAGTLKAFCPKEKSTNFAGGAEDVQAAEKQTRRWCEGWIFGIICLNHQNGIDSRAQAADRHCAMKMYPRHAESMLGFDLVRSRLRRYLLGPLGTNALDQITTASTLAEVRTRLGRVGELQCILQRRQGPPLEDFLDVRDSLERIAPEGGYVSGAELLDIRRVCRTMRRLRQWFAGSEYPLLRALVAQITLLRPVEDHIGAAIGPGGEVRSTASAALARIRRLLRSRKEALRARLMTVLRDASSRGYAAGAQPTVRGGRMVVPVRIEAKRKVRGFVHGISATGQTVYIEPADCLELNNEIRLLEEEERREVERILRAASALVRRHGTALRTNLGCLGCFDLLQAAARMANRIEAVTPDLNACGAIDIRQGRNPALMLHLGGHNAVVPMDVSLGDTGRTLVITGPNAGGKTVAMKTVGLSAVMIAYGLPVPMHPDSSLCLFDKVMVEIGDNQSIEQDLSTFSARIRGLSTMVNEAGPGTLVLIDEIGAGTDPAEGSALAQAALEHLTAAEACTVVTTHHGTLKAFAHEAAGVENGSMEFDQTTLAPTFHFRQGLPGTSYALLVAERLSIDVDVLARARALLGGDHMPLESLLLSLQEQQKALAEKHRALDGRLVRSRIFRRPGFQAAPQKKQASRTVRRRPGSKRKGRVPAHVVAGAQVVLDGGTVVGEVLSVDGTKATVTFGAMRAQIEAERLRPAPRKARRRPVVKAVSHNARAALDVRGLRTRDATRAVDKLLDNARQADIRAVQILHGKGTGALREAIHGYLSESDAVAEFSTPQVNPGVTYVRLA